MRVLDFQQDDVSLVDSFLEVIVVEEYGISDGTSATIDKDLLRRFNLGQQYFNENITFVRGILMRYCKIASIVLHIECASLNLVLLHGLLLI